MLARLQGFNGPFEMETVGERDVYCIECGVVNELYIGECQFLSSEPRGGNSTLVGRMDFRNAVLLRICLCSLGVARCDCCAD